MVFITEPVEVCYWLVTALLEAQVETEKSLHPFFLLFPIFLLFPHDTPYRVVNEVLLN